MLNLRPPRAYFSTYGKFQLRLLIECPLPFCSSEPLRSELSVLYIKKQRVMAMVRPIILNEFICKLLVLLR